MGRGEEAKIKFLSKFYPGICYSPGGSQRLEGGTDRSSGSADMRKDERTALNRIQKRKAEQWDFYSPTKKLKNNIFSKTQNFWKQEEIKHTGKFKNNRNTLGNSDLAEPPDRSAANMEGTIDLAEFDKI